MDKILVAIATDDGRTLPESHFGDAALYAIYQLNSQDYEFLKRISNTAREEEETHGDARKAGSIGKLLKTEGVQALVSRQFGKNITRMRKEFLPVVVSTENLVQTLKQLQQNYEYLVIEWKKGIERKHVILR